MTSATTVREALELLLRTVKRENELRGVTQDVHSAMNLADDVLTRSERTVVPEGWDLVPNEPTEDMIRAVDVREERRHLVRANWKAMIAAAPKHSRVDKKRESPADAVRRELASAPFISETASGGEAFVPPSRFTNEQEGAPDPYKLRQIQDILERIEADVFPEGVQRNHVYDWLIEATAELEHFRKALARSSTSFKMPRFGAGNSKEMNDLRCSMGYHVAPYKDASVRANYYCSHCKQGMGNAYFELREAFDALALSASANVDHVTEGTVEQDAARFRWLTRQVRGEIRHVGAMYRRWWWDTYDHPKTFPAAIDARLNDSDRNANG